MAECIPSLYRVILKIRRTSQFSTLTRRNSSNAQNISAFTVAEIAWNT
jgi:hypothetical protein